MHVFEFVGIWKEGFKLQICWKFVIQFTGICFRNIWERISARKNNLRWHKLGTNAFSLFDFNCSSVRSAIKSTQLKLETISRFVLINDKSRGSNSENYNSRRLIKFKAIQSISLKNYEFFWNSRKPWALSGKRLQNRASRGVLDKIIFKNKSRRRTKSFTRNFAIHCILR